MSNKPKLVRNGVGGLSPTYDDGLTLDVNLPRFNPTPEARRRIREGLPDWLRYTPEERRSMAVNRMLAGSEE